MHVDSPLEVINITLASLAGRHPIADATIALIVFLAAFSVIGSALWLMRRQNHG